MFSLFVSQLGNGFEDDQHGTIKSVRQYQGPNPLTSKCNSISFIMTSIMVACKAYGYYPLIIQMLLVLNRKVYRQYLYALFKTWLCL